MRATVTARLVHLAFHRTPDHGFGPHRLAPRPYLYRRRVWAKPEDLAGRVAIFVRWLVYVMTFGKAGAVPWTWETAAEPPRAAMYYEQEVDVILGSGHLYHNGRAFVGPPLPDEPPIPPPNIAVRW